MVSFRVSKLVKIQVRGIVQGVGFRPFVYRLAKEHNLKGWVRNTSGNVDIEVEGDEADLNCFVAELKTRAPAVAYIESISTALASERGYTDFHIHESQAKTGQYQLVSPDIATCPECRQEIFNPADRRYGYAFTNCTNCGPRFTIIEDIPYDRPRTTMCNFKMCPECQREYDDPGNRRFHAQPNACPECGPSLKLIDERGNRIEAGNEIKAAAGLLKSGKIIALRGLGGFHLACDAADAPAVIRLRQRKRRPDKPFAVMLASIPDIEAHCLVTDEEKKLLQSSQCPIVLLKWKPESHIVPEVAPHLKYLGVMLPYTPLHHLLLHEVNLPLVMTSGNLSEEPIAKDNDEALSRLKGIADYFLLHNRDIYVRYDDSVFLVENGPRAVRRARSYAPYPVFLPFKSRQILGCGAEEKNTFCLSRDEHCFLSQHIGDMANEETFDHYRNTIELYRRLFRVNPEIIAYDMHPEYLATRYALEQAKKLDIRLVAVQHHHAHIVSCLAENQKMGPVIGVAFDGTGYSPDGTIWGGEFLVADWQKYRRMGHLEYVPMPGGAAAIKKPYRMALSYVYSLLGEDFSLSGLGIDASNEEEVDIIKQQLRRKLNSPVTSSAGRLFDAVSVLLGFRGEISYEAQAAIELEMMAADESAGSYPYTIDATGEEGIVRLGGLLASVIIDIRSGVPASIISGKFHQTIAEMIGGTVRMISQETGIRQVALSGGVFQNRQLFRRTLAALEQDGFEVFTHHMVPCNDGGISLGQVGIAHFAVEKD